MKKIIVTTAAFVICASAAFAGGVSSISNSGKVSGNSAYSIQCSNGKEWRIWRSSNQWWDGRGAQGGQSRSLNEQAAFLCR